MKAALAGLQTACSEITLLVNPDDVSFAIGQKRSNIHALLKEFGIRDIRILSDRSTPKRTVQRIDKEGRRFVFHRAP
jgi:transcription antitermination factor NusA-like protein